MSYVTRSQFIDFEDNERFKNISLVPSEYFRNPISLNDGKLIRYTCDLVPNKRYLIEIKLNYTIATGDFFIKFYNTDYDYKVVKAEDFISQYEGSDTIKCAFYYNKEYDYMDIYSNSIVFQSNNIEFVNLYELKNALSVIPTEISVMYNLYSNELTGRRTTIFMINDEEVDLSNYQEYTNLPSTAPYVGNGTFKPTNIFFFGGIGRAIVNFKVEV